MRVLDQILTSVSSIAIVLNKSDNRYDTGAALGLSLSPPSSFASY